MRWKDIVEDVQKPPRSRPKWRAKMLAAMMQPESMFTAIQPEESGLDRTIYASESSRHPVVIVDARKGKFFAPDETAIVLTFGELSGSPQIDKWLATNADALRAYASGDFDSVDFFKAMQCVHQRTDETIRLDEMANFRKGRFNVPITFWIRPEPNPLEHEARVKCNANYTDRPSDDNFSIQLLPTPALAMKDGKPHDTGNVSGKDVAGMIRWVGLHQQTFLDFYSGRISQSALDKALTMQPYK